MADQTPRMKLPFMSTSQLNKELTFNEMAFLTDALIGAIVIDRDLTAPPASPDDGDMYIPAATATGAWAGKEDNLAVWIGSWHFIEPQNGWIIWVDDESGYVRWNPSTSVWQTTLVIPPSNLVELLDVNAPAPGPDEDGYALGWDDAAGEFVLQPGATTLAGLTDVDLSGVEDGDWLQYDLSSSAFVTVSFGAFTDLSDAPSDYTGQNGKLVGVNESGDGLTFYDPPEASGGVRAFNDLSDAPGTYTNFGGYVLVVNETEDGLSYALIEELAQGVPAGGSTNEVLRKTSNNDYETEWVDLTTVVPTIPDGGTTGQILAKATDDDGDVYWIDASEEVFADAPSDGTLYGRKDGAWAAVGIQPLETVNETAATANLSNSNQQKYHRWTNASAKALTVQPEATEAIDQDAEFHIRNAATAGDITITAGAGVVINPPAGGTLVLAPGMSVTLKRVAEDEFDLIGHTVAV